MSGFDLGAIADILHNEDDAADKHTKQDTRFDKKAKGDEGRIDTEVGKRPKGIHIQRKGNGKEWLFHLHTGKTAF